MYYVVTGAAGFVGSNLVRALNARGETQILAVDDLEGSDKFRNLAACEIADYLVGLGAHEAIALDGGGSSTFAARDEAGAAVLLSRPCHTKVPGRQRPVANFLGIASRR